MLAFKLVLNLNRRYKDLMRLSNLIMLQGFLISCKLILLNGSIQTFETSLKKLCPNDYFFEKSQKSHSNFTPDPRSLWKLSVSQTHSSSPVCEMRTSFSFRFKSPRLSKIRGVARKKKLEKGSETRAKSYQQ